MCEYMSLSHTHLSLSLSHTHTLSLSLTHTLSLSHTHTHSLTHTHTHTSLSHTPLSVQAVFARDALSKAIYDRLFTWLVGRINDSIKVWKHGGMWYGRMTVWNILGKGY